MAEPTSLARVMKWVAWLSHVSFLELGYEFSSIQIIWTCYQTKLRSPPRCRAKSVYWHWVVVKESTVFIAGLQAKRMGSSCSEDPNSLMAYRKGVLKGNIRGEGSRERYQLVDICLIGWWWNNQWWGWYFRKLNLLVPTSLGSMCFCSTCGHRPSVGGGLSFCRTTQRYMSNCSLYPFKRKQESCDSIVLIINWLSLLFGTWGHRRVCHWEDPTGSCLVSDWDVRRSDSPKENQNGITRSRDDGCWAG